MRDHLPTSPNPAAAGIAVATAGPVLDVVIPVYNEEIELVRSVETVHRHLSTLPYSFRITIADNASTDDTSHLARSLAARMDHVRAVILDRKGRGVALKEVWSHSDAQVLVYMDVDLSTDLNALLPLVAPLLSGHSDLAIGTRLARASRTRRGPKREFISRSYNHLLRGALHAKFSDAQCGFKAIRRDVAEQLLPLVQDDSWFFDTEMLVLAERAGLRIHEVPVDWTDDPDSRVDIARTAMEDLRGMWRVGTDLMRGNVDLAQVRESLGRKAEDSARGGLNAQLVIFAIIGVASTIAYALLYLAMRPAVGPQWSNFLALVITAIANTAANRRFTFGITQAEGSTRHQVQGLMVFGAGWVATAGALAGYHQLAGTGHPAAEMVLLTVANLGVTVVRFVAMRLWIFRSR